MNRSSLLVPGQVTKTQEVNGTNGSAASPVPDAPTQTAPSSDSEQDEAGDTDESMTSKSLSSSSRPAWDTQSAVPGTNGVSLWCRIGSQGPDGAALSVLWKERPRPQFHAVQTLLLYFLCTRVRRGVLGGGGSGPVASTVRLFRTRRRFNVRLTKGLRALSAGSRAERPRPALNRAESVPGKPLLLRLVEAQINSL